jgi:hypothetical protein
MDAKAYPLPTIDHVKADVPSMQCGGLGASIELSLDSDNSKARQGHPFPPAEYSSIVDAGTHQTPSESQLPLVRRFGLYQLAAGAIGFSPNVDFVGVNRNQLVVEGDASQPIGVADLSC